MRAQYSKAVAAAAAGLLGAVACGGTSTPEAESPETAGETASAEGKDCCRGKNECKGQGGCAVEGSHECKGNNECKGLGGCNMHCPK